MKKGISLKNVTKEFVISGDMKVVAVKNVNLEIEPGEFITLLGPSGCGKTTLLRMVAGFETPTDGEIFIGKENVSPLTPDKRDTALVFQNYALFPHMNVYDNIAYGLKLKKIPKAEMDARVDKILDLMKMKDFAKRVPSQMSGGQQQRVSLARALVMEPGVLLFDEPLSNLDAKLRIHMRDEIRRIQKTVGITSLYVTHDQSEAMGLSDKIVIMRDGVIEQVGSPKEIYQRPANAFVANFIGVANIVKGVIKSSTDNGYEVGIGENTFKITSNSKHKKGDEVEIVVRPESVRIGEKQFKTVVSKSIFMGNNHEYEVDLNGTTLKILQSDPNGKKDYVVGDKMWIQFEESAMHIL